MSEKLFYNGTLQEGQAFVNVAWMTSRTWRQIAVAAKEKIRPSLPHRLDRHRISVVYE